MGLAREILRCAARGYIPGNVIPRPSNWLVCPILGASICAAFCFRVSNNTFYGGGGEGEGGSVSGWVGVETVIVSL